MIIDVILPTYNGKKFLSQMIHSIYNQTLRPRMLWIRDDGSTDGTIELIMSLQSLYSTWLNVVPSNGNVGVIENINCILKLTTAPYVAFADQDDIWLPDKLEKSSQVMAKNELRNGTDIPILVHTNLDLIDARGVYLQTSYMYKKLFSSKP